MNVSLALALEAIKRTRESSLFQAKLSSELSEQQLPFKQVELQLEYLQKVAQEKQNQLNDLKLSFDSNLKSYNSLINRQHKKVQQLKRMITLQMSMAENQTIPKENDDETLKRLKMEVNKLLGLSPGLNNLTSDNYDVQLPDSYKMLPHLKVLPRRIQPLFKQSKSRIANIAIGIPTIKRPKTSYLYETIKSLIYSMNDLEQAEALIVIMIGEVIIVIFKFYL